MENGERVEMINCLNARKKENEFFRLDEMQMIFTVLESDELPLVELLFHSLSESQWFFV